MGHGQGHDLPDPRTGEDYSYDLAHDAGAFERTGWTGRHEHAPVYVATETTDTGQDYSYDLAHDVPPAPGAEQHH